MIKSALEVRRAGSQTRGEIMEKGQIISGIKIEDMSAEGNGIGRYGGMAVFAGGCVPGDTVSAEIVKLKKSYAVCRLVSIDEPSPDRVKPDCPYFGGCGGCAFRNISYEAELVLKEKQVRDKLVRIAGIKEPNLAPIVGMRVGDGGAFGDDASGAPGRYRNKAQFPVSTGGVITERGGIVRALGEPKVGFYARGSHELTDIDDCLIQSRAATAAAEALKRFMKEDNITAWDDKWQRGLMRHLIVKTAESTGEVMVILVINGKGIPNAEKLVGMLDNAVYDAGYSLESVVINVNKEKTSRITGDEYITIAGKPTIMSECMGLVFEISPSAFYQVNPVQTEVLYGKVLEYADLSGSETVFDLYCGVGTIGLILADRMRKLTREKYGADDYEKTGRVYGVEYVKGAVLDANRNAVINGIVNAEFICGKAEEKTEAIINGYEDKDGRTLGGKVPDVVIVDPPRSGCDEKLIETLVRALPQRIVYVSCDPATLARDIKALGDYYELAEATPVDMFPRTGNVEVVCLLSKLKSDKHI